MCLCILRLLAIYTGELIISTSSLQFVEYSYLFSLFAAQYLVLSVRWAW